MSGQGTPDRSGASANTSVADVVSAALNDAPKKKRQVGIHANASACIIRVPSVTDGNTRYAYFLTQCDRKIPCQPCVERGLGELCHPYGEGDQFGNLHERVRRLEVLVQGLASDHKNLELKLAKVDYSDGERDRSVSPDRDATSMKPMPFARSARDPAAMYGMERGELVRLEERGAGEDAKPPAATSLSNDGTSWFGELALPSMSQRAVCAEVDGECLEVQSSIPRSPASARIATLIAEGGAAPNVVQVLMDLIPPKEKCDKLVANFFRELNDIVVPVHEQTFRLVYDELMNFRFGDPSTQNQGDGARHIPFLASLFMFLAHASLMLPTSECTDKEAVDQALHFFHAGRQCIEVGSFIRGDHIDLVAANLLASKFCIMFRRTSKVWMYIGAAVRGAQSMGLHRDGGKLGLDAVTTERRRRLWSVLYHWDKVISILVSRPSAIFDAHCDTLPPSDVPLEQLDATKPAQPPTGLEQGPLPTSFLFIAVRHELGRLMGKISEMYQDLRHPVRHDDVMRMDAQLSDLITKLPPIYRLATQPGADHSKDEKSPVVHFHRYLINVELNFARITLHRPYVLRTNSKYSRSREIAFDTARNDRYVRDEFDKVVPPDTRARCYQLGGLYRLFNTVLMYGIMLLLERDPKEREANKAFLEQFIEQNKMRTDLCSRREIKIVQMFLSRAEEHNRDAAKRRAQRASARAQAQASQDNSVANSTPERSQSWDDLESAQTFLTNLGSFNGASLETGAAQPPMQTNDAYFPPTTGAEMNLNLLQPGSDLMSDLDPSSAAATFDQRLAMYDTDFLMQPNVWQGGFSYPSGTTPGYMPTDPASLFPMMQSSSSFDSAYVPMPPQGFSSNGMTQPNMMPWEGMMGTPKTDTP